MEQAIPETTATKSFGPVQVVHPRAKHTHTIVLIHGRGSTAEEFAEELSESTLSSGKALQEAFPGWKWVFPSSKEPWSTTFQEFMPAWFEAQSLADPTMRQDLQIEGIRDSVSHVNELIEKELQLLGGKAENMRTGPQSGSSVFDLFVKDMMEPAQHGPARKISKECLETPVFMGHGADDAYVDIELGREAKEILSEAGFSVSWKEYTGAEEEGHWLKVPEEIDDIEEFLTRIDT
ncbi:Acyl-protein thioesterase 1 [Ceratocystis platani]|uniref:Acyl-protein thioesterase 1 n=1 Tax=Ceratocystis fimbriata f. sp. platani TaxID=88771 RepID=A0A0F8BS71_CERFI|nr:Acyl-protein thioesterase 1 [Ceratocystis platani]